MCAFVPTCLPTSLAPSRSAFGGSAVKTTTTASRSVVWCRPATRHVTNAVMSEPSETRASSIDFGKVNIEDIGSNLAGLVFTPESTSTSLKTRVDVGYTTLQESAVNAHINVEYTAMYAYHALWSYFDRDTIALPGFAKYFYEQSVEEREHAHEFMQYQNRRGGHVELQPLALPEMKFTDSEHGISDALYAMDLHLQLEKFVYHKLVALHQVAEQDNDSQMQDFVEGYLTHQLEAIKTAAEYVSQIKRVATPHGVYQIDLTLRE